LGKKKLFELKKGFKYNDLKPFFKISRDDKVTCGTPVPPVIGEGGADTAINGPMGLCHFIAALLEQARQLRSETTKPPRRGGFAFLSVGMTGQLSNLLIRELRVFVEFVNSTKGLAKLEIFAYRS